MIIKMKIKHINIMSLIISIFLIIILCGFQGDNNEVKVQGIPIEKKNQAYDLSLNIPKIIGLKNKKFENEINNMLLQQGLDFQKQVEKEGEENAAEAKKAGQNIEAFIGKEDFKVQYNGKDLLSIPINFYYFSGGAHGIAKITTINIDKEKGKVIGLKDLFKEEYDYKSSINKKIQEEINKNSDQYFPDAFKGINENSEFFLTEDGIVIYYQLYELAPYAEGFPQFKIPYSLLKQGLKYEI